MRLSGVGTKPAALNTVLLCSGADIYKQYNEKKHLYKVLRSLGLPFKTEMTYARVITIRHNVLSRAEINQLNEVVHFLRYAMKLAKKLKQLHQ